MKRMLINATQPEELRVALVDGQWLYDLDIENRTRQQKKANIYKGKITRVEPSLEAAFVDYGEERHGFLPLKEISREYFSKQPKDIDGRVKIKDVVKEGMEVIVQVDKEERGNKGAALTTFISLAGRYLVLMPNNPRAGGISRRIEGDERSELRDALSSVEVPSGMGIIVRTAGVGRSGEELQWDLNYLLQLWDAIKTEADDSKAPHFLFQESNVIIRAIRDYMRDDIGEVIVDDKGAYQLAAEFARQVMPHYASKVKYYEDAIPLFNRYQIESQIETAFEREVKLPSGGSIVIDVTEALVSIDINSSRATKGGDIEETARSINLEAADEIARQLRLRDMGGLVVIDFIDMQSKSNQREVEKRMDKALSMDRARVQIGRISRFGLLEMSRQRLRPSLGETTFRVCPRCSGQGTIRGTKSLALSILRLVEEEAKKERSAEIRAICPVNVATYLLNEKRKAISQIESRNNTRVVVVPNADLETPHFEVQRLRDDETATLETSYKISGTLEEAADRDEEPMRAPAQPAVQQLAHTAPAPTPTPAAAPAPAAKPQPGLISRLISAISALFSGEEEDKGKKKHKKTKDRGKTYEKRGRGQRGNRGGRSGRGGRRREDDRPESKREDKQARKQAEKREDKREAKREEQREEKREEKGAAKRDEAQGAERPQRRRRRRRGGEGRRRREEGQQVAEQSTTAEQAESPATEAEPESRERPQRRPSNVRGRPQARRRGRRGENAAAAAVAQGQEELNREVNEAIDEAEGEAKKSADRQPKPAETTTAAQEAAPAAEKAEQAQPAEAETQAAKESSTTATGQAASAEEATRKPRRKAEAGETGEVEKKARRKREPEAAGEKPQAEQAAAATEKPQGEQAPTAGEKPAVSAPKEETPPAEPATAAEEAAPAQKEEPRQPQEAVKEAAPETQQQPEQEEQKPAAEAPQEPTVGKERQPAEEAVAESAPQEEEAAAEPVAEEAAAVATPAATAPGRASNDPRVNPRPLGELAIVTEQRDMGLKQPLDTSRPAAIEHQPRALARPANDPRVAREAPQANDESDSSAEAS
ncbi:ribonuclease E [Microbulbifer yueqingensis]|uniref:Ribonuclease E n=1 Tax=Microbulbifer yueqingensis TaxID=658219 RepID=A0A1G8ZK79_9GAMM|nr:ribonuclease E [Microbulbifer yueqingensis]SDK15438.1 RNAse E [Microbulbifer yueqingensis]